MIKSEIIQKIDTEWRLLSKDENQEHADNSTNLYNIISKARQKGIFLLEEDQISEKRRKQSASLAKKLVRFPSRTMSLDELDPISGIVATNNDDEDQKVIFKTIHGTHDKVQFTFGLPYFFDRFNQQNNEYQNTGIVVLNGDAILGRQDLKIPYIDIGVLFKSYNPLSNVLDKLREEHPDFIPTPLLLFYQYIAQDQDRKEYFLNIMQQTLSQYTLAPNQLENYISEALTHSFPFNNDHPELTKKWSPLVLPQGILNDQISPDEIRAVIVTEKIYDRTQRLLQNKDIQVINAGKPKNATNSNGITISNINLLHAYVETTDAVELEEFQKNIQNGTNDIISEESANLFGKL